MWVLHAGFLAQEVVPTVPAPMLAEAWRGGSREASVARFLALCAIKALTERQAKAAGALAGRADHHDIVDVTVVVEGADPQPRGSARVRVSSAQLVVVACPLTGLSRHEARRSAVLPVKDFQPVQSGLRARPHMRPPGPARFRS